MITFASPLAFDSKGNALHKGDLCNQITDMGEGNTPDMIICQIEIFDILPNNRAVCILPDSTTEVLETGKLDKIIRSEEPSLNFSEDTIQKENEDEEFQRIRMLTEDNTVFDGIADILLLLVKKVSKVVIPLQFKVNKVSHTKVAKDGIVTEGTVECQIQVKDNYSARKGTANIRLSIVNGQVSASDTFSVGESVEYPFTEAGFKKWLDIPETQYVSKKPSPVVRSNRDSY